MPPPSAAIAQCVAGAKQLRTPHRLRVTAAGTVDDDTARVASSTSSTRPLRQLYCRVVDLHLQHSHIDAARRRETYSTYVADRYTSVFAGLMAAACEAMRATVSGVVLLSWRRV
jgi:hypothetical protein